MRRIVLTDMTQAGIQKAVDDLAEAGGVIYIPDEIIPAEALSPVEESDSSRIDPDSRNTDT